MRRRHPLHHPTTTISVSFDRDGGRKDQWVWTMSTLQGDRLATSLAIEPRTRPALCTRLLPTTIIDAFRRVASSTKPLATSLITTANVTGTVTFSSPAIALR